MADKSSHLDQLRIDRSRAKPTHWSGMTSILVIILLGSGAGGYYFFRATPRIPVHIITAEDRRASGGAGLDASGYVVARRKATLSAQIIGRVMFLNAEEGQKVRRGDVVARVDDSNYSAALRQAQAQQRQAKAALDDAAPIYARYQRLRDQNAISIDAFENERAAYDAARAALGVTDAAVAVALSNEDFTTVRAPFTGVVTDKVAQVGEIVSPAAAGGGDTRTGIATIVDMDSLEVEVEVSENYIDRVHAGQQAGVQLSAYPDWDIPASVIAVIPTADQNKGTVKVRIALNVKDRRILPQMAARVSFLTEPRPATNRADVTLPLDAVLGSDRTGTVFVIRDNTAEARRVKLGLRTPQFVTILSGVEPGERLAISNLNILHDGAKIDPLD